MANEKRLIDANVWRHETCLWCNEHYPDEPCEPSDCPAMQYIDDFPTVDAVPVDEIRVDIMSLSLENQEAILNVSICGKPNEVKIPFSKEVAEVVHGRWIWTITGEEDWAQYYVCSECGERSYTEDNYCPNCGAKMDGDGNGKL